MRADLQGQREARRLRVRVGPPGRRVQAHGPVASRHGRGGARSRGGEPLDAGEGVARRARRAAQSRKHLLRQRRDPVRVRHPVDPRRRLAAGPRGRPERALGASAMRAGREPTSRRGRGRARARRLLARERRSEAFGRGRSRFVLRARDGEKRHRRAPFPLRVDGRRRPRHRRPAAVRGRAVAGDRRSAGRPGVPEAAAGVPRRGRGAEGGAGDEPKRRITKRRVRRRAPASRR